MFAERGKRMVKGVNKTIIEVNNTGSKMFEKIVFYVSPQYGNADIARLQRAAGEFSLRFDESESYAPLRRKHIKKRKKRLIIALSSAFVALAVVIGVCFL